MIKNRFHSCLKKRYDDNNNQRININFDKVIKKIKKSDNISNKDKEKDNDDNSKMILNRSTEATTINNLKESSIISKLSYQPNFSIINNKVEKDGRKNIDFLIMN